MIDRELVETIAAFGVVLACALSALATADPTRRERRAVRRAERGRHVRPERARSSRRRAAAAAIASAPASATPGGRVRPRILTGEPVAAEPPRSGVVRAFKLVAGITLLAAGGALGLLALVRALVVMVQEIAG